MPIWLKPIFCLLFLTPWLLGNGECNAFIGSANKESDEALMYAAQQAIDQGNFDLALATIARVSAERRGSRDGRVLEATAYGGKCGLNFIGLAKDLVDKISTQRLLEILLTNMRAATSYGDCVSAETLMMGIPADDMKSDDHVFLAFLEFAKMGAVLAANGAGDASGNVNPAFDSCALPDADAGQIGTGINIAVSAIGASGISVAGSTTDLVDQLCDDIAAIPLPGTWSPCGITDPTGFSSVQLRAIRSLVQANEIGLNTCGGPISDLVSCICP